MVDYLENILLWKFAIGYGLYPNLSFCYEMDAHMNSPIINQIAFLVYDNVCVTL
jgi:hypothetical protein